MADSGFDPCECVFSHEFAMRRLLTLLRESQGYCTDNECFTDGPLPAAPETGSSDVVFYTMLWAMIAFLLFFLRPSSLRGALDSKPRAQNENNPPPPPAST